MGKKETFIQIGSSFSSGSFSEVLNITLSLI